MQILRNNFMYFHGLASVLPLKMNRTLVLTSRDPSFAPLPLPPVPGSLLHPSPMSFKIWGCNINNDRLSSVPCCPCLSAIVTGHSQHVINSSYGNEWQLFLSRDTHKTHLLKQPSVETLDPPRKHLSFDPTLIKHDQGSMIQEKLMDFLGVVSVQLKIQLPL